MMFQQLWIPATFPQAKLCQSHLPSENWRTVSCQAVSSQMQYHHDHHHQPHRGVTQSNQLITIFNVAQIVKLLRSPRERIRWKQKCHSKMWGKDLRKRNVLSCWWKIDKEGDDWMSTGKEFQRMDAATWNEYRPTVDWQKDGTWSSWVLPFDQTGWCLHPADDGTHRMKWFNFWTFHLIEAI